MRGVVLKVLHVIAAVAPRYGGPSEVVRRMAGELRVAGVDASLAATDADGRGRLPVRTDVLEDFRGVPAVFFRRQFSESFKYSRPFARWLSAHARDFDCVHVHGVFSHSSLAAARACRRASVPFIVRPLGALEDWSLAQKPIRKRIVLALGAGRMLRAAAAIHYTTERERRESENATGLSNGVVIPLGVDVPGAPHPPTPSPASGEGASSFPSPHGGEGWRVERRGEARSALESPFLLFLSRLHPKKGVEILIDAFEIIAGDPRFRDWELVIAGDGEPGYAAALRERASRKASRDRIRFAGWLDGDRKSRALAGAGLFVLPSAQENFGLAALEAMAAGIPVAVSREVDLSDEIEAAHAGWVFERTVNGLSAALTTALAGRQELRTRGDNGLDVVRRKFLWPVIAGQLETLYRKVCDLASPSPLVGEGKRSAGEG